MKFNLMKREPSYFFENIHEDLERFLKETFGDLEPVMPDSTPFERRFRPAVEIYETDKEYKIDVELAGAKKEDICVELTEKSVSIDAKIKFEKKEEKGNLYYSEFRYGEFQRNIPLNKKINTASSSCEFKDGILHLKLAKKDVENKEETIKLAVN